MKRLLVIMLILVAVGVVNAARITIHADTQIKLSWNITPATNWVPENDNIIYVPTTPKFYNIKIEWLDISRPVWNTEYAHVDVWNMDDDIHLYYQFVTANEPTDPINQ
ncbi:MAG: hypothetical protein WC155_01100 [Candidatus Cloacimonadales bacterium]